MVINIIVRNACRTGNIEAISVKDFLEAKKVTIQGEDMRFFKVNNVNLIVEFVGLKKL